MSVDEGVWVRLGVVYYVEEGLDGGGGGLTGGVFIGLYDLQVNKTGTKVSIGGFRWGSLQM